MNASFFGQAIDLTKAEPSSFEPMPAGDYIAVCTEFDAEQKDNGLIANLKFQIIDGPYANRLIWQSLPITHTSEKAQSFGQSMLAGWCDALGVDKSNLTSGEPLMNKPVGVKLKIEPAREYNGRTYDARNQIARFMSTDQVGAPPARPAAPPPAQKAVQPVQPAAPAPATQAAAAPATSAKMPWQK